MSPVKEGVFEAFMCGCLGNGAAVFAVFEVVAVRLNLSHDFYSYEVQTFLKLVCVIAFCGFDHHIADVVRIHHVLVLLDSNGNPHLSAGPRFLSRHETKIDLARHGFCFFCRRAKPRVMQASIYSILPNCELEIDDNVSETIYKIQYNNWNYIIYFLKSLEIYIGECGSYMQYIDNENDLQYFFRACLEDDQLSGDETS